MINIAFFINGAKPPRGGEFATLNLIKNSSKVKFHPIVIYAEEGLIIKKIKQAGIDTLKVPLRNEITTFNIKEVFYNPLKLCNFIWYLLWSGYIFKVIRVLKRNNIDLIHAADHISKLVCGIAGKLVGIKVIAHCHDDFSGPFWRDNHNATGKLLKLINYLFVDKIIAVSEKSRSCFKVNGKISPKVITIYNGIDVNIYDPDKVDHSLIDELGIKERCMIIGSIGVLDKHKGQIYLFKAIEKLKADGITDILCLVCGVGPEEENLKKFVKEEGLTKEVFFLGFREDLPRILKILDIMVITSFHESFSMVAVEAMAMQVPVIGTKVGALPEVIADGRTGILVPSGSVDALFGALKYLIKNPRVRIKMGKDGRKRVLEKFTLEKNVNETEKVYLEMFKGKERHYKDI